MYLSVPALTSTYYFNCPFHPLLPFLFTKNKIPLPYLFIAPLIYLASVGTLTTFQNNSRLLITIYVDPIVLQYRNLCDLAMAKKCLSWPTAPPVASISTLCNNPFFAAYHCQPHCPQCNIDNNQASFAPPFSLTYQDASCPFPLICPDCTTRHLPFP